MSNPPALVRTLAQRLLAAEAADQIAAPSNVHEAVKVCEKLRTSLVRLAGSDGFASLLRRAVSLARDEVPALDQITVNPDCSMAGLEDLVADTTGRGAKGPEAITAHLLGLLVIFIGEPLTMRIVRETWPDASWDELPRN